MIRKLETVTFREVMIDSWFRTPGGTQYVKVTGARAVPFVGNAESVAFPPDERVVTWVNVPRGRATRNPGSEPMTAVVYADGGNKYLGRFPASHPFFWEEYGRKRKLGSWAHVGHKYEGKDPVGLEELQVVVYDDHPWPPAEIARRNANGFLGITAYRLSGKSNPGGDGGGTVSRFAGKLFLLGQLVMTAGISDAVADDTAMAIFVTKCLKRHASGDWGDMAPEDLKENEFSLGKHLRLFSSYNLPSGISRHGSDDKVWIITEADRSVTTILWPSDY